MIYRIPKNAELFESNRLLELILNNSDGVNHKPVSTEVSMLDRGRLLYSTDKANTHTWELQNAYIANDATLEHNDDYYVLLPLSVNESWRSEASRERIVTLACLNDESGSSAGFLDLFKKTTVDGKLIGNLITEMWLNPMTVDSQVWVIDLYGLYNAGAIPDDYTHIWYARVMGAHLLPLSDAITVDYDVMGSTGVAKTSANTFMNFAYISGDTWVTTGSIATLEQDRGLANLVDYIVPAVFESGDLFDTVTFSYHYIWISSEELVFFQSAFDNLKALVLMNNQNISGADRIYLRS